MADAKQPELWSPKLFLVRTAPSKPMWANQKQSRGETIEGLIAFPTSRVTFSAMYHEISRVTSTSDAKEAAIERYICDWSKCCFCKAYRYGRTEIEAYQLAQDTLAGKAETKKMIASWRAAWRKAHVIQLKQAATTQLTEWAGRNLSEAEVVEGAQLLLTLTTYLRPMMGRYGTKPPLPLDEEFVNRPGNIYARLRERTRVRTIMYQADQPKWLQLQQALWCHLSKQPLDATDFTKMVTAVGFDIAWFPALP